MRFRTAIRALTVVLLAPSVVVFAEAAQAADRPSAFQPMKAQPGAYAKVAPPPVDPSADHNLTAAPAVDWPVTGSAQVAPRSGEPGRKAGRLPVRVGARAAKEAPEQVTVTTLGRAESERAKVTGPLIRLTAPGRGDVSVEVDYTGFRDAYGGDWASRARLVQVPECRADRPGDPACRPVPLATANDPVKGVASAQVALAGTNTLLALESGPAGSGGDFTASSPAASGTWSAGGSSGDFNWSYPMRTPPPLGGPAPQLALGYSSGSLDGRTAASNNQPSWAGDGFDLWSGAVSRSYKPCADDGQAGVGDLCWGGDNATLALSSHSGELIQEQGNPDRWRLRNDDGTRVERLFGADNGVWNGEHWRVTTTDGVQYFFGLSKLPGAPDDQRTSSAWKVPVFGNQAGERCHNGSGFAASWCDQAYRWNLDYVVDPHGNSMSIWYDVEWNSYARNKTDNTVSRYVRGGTINRIDYGTRRDGGVDSRFAGPVPMRAQFGTADRCVTPGGTCTLTKANAANWPDVPMDQLCDSTATCVGVYAPTFWTQKRLATVTTQVLRGDQLSDVEQWTLRHVYKDPGDGRAKVLWLSAIGQTGLSGGRATLPDVKFGGVPLNNRVDRTSTLEPIIRYRVSSIETATGGVIGVNYSAPDCVLGSRMPANPESSTLRCFPVYWTRPGQTKPGFDYFHKYVVTSVTETDRTGAAPTAVTGYQYLDHPAWHYDEAEFVQPERRSWGQWRGYGRVRVIKGAEGQTRSQTDTLYFRGMHGDRLPDKRTRNVSVTDSDGVALPDSAWQQGKVRETIVYNGTGDAAPVVSKTKHDPWKHGPTATRDRNGVVVEAYVTGVAATTVKTALDGARGWRTTRVDNTFDYDDGSAHPTGRITRKDDAGDITTPDDDRCTRTTYAANPDTHALAYPAEIETVGVRCSATPDRASNTLSRIRVAYDGGPGVGKGDQVKVEQMVGWNDGEPVFRQTMRAAYDAYGRATETFDERGRRSTVTYLPAAGPLTRTEETNPLGWKTSTTVDPGFGRTTLAVDVNGRRTQTAYDALGRVTAVWTPGRDSDQTPSSRYSYDVRADAPTVTSVARLNAAGDGYLTSYQIYDGLMRERQTQMPAVGGGSMVTDSGYDSRGKIRKKSAPYFMPGAPSGALFVSKGEPPSATWFEYDAAERKTAEILRASGEELWRTTFAHGGDHTDTTPPRGGTPTSLYTDARGQQSELRQYLGDTVGGSFERTRYTYTATGKPATLVDPAGNTWRWEYDHRDRLTSTSDPDKGVTTRTYDQWDQLATFTDARGKRIAYRYDDLSRRTSVHQDTVNGPKLVSWEYDTLLNGYPTASTRHVGDHAYRTAFSGYDEESRPTGTVLTVPEAEGKLAGTYRTSQTFNADGSPDTTSLPAIGGLPAETLRYGYNATGQPTSLTGAAAYLTDAIYDQAGRLGISVRTNTAGKSLLEEWAYHEATGRVVEHAGYGDVNPEVITDAHYTYDPSGNLIGIADRTSQYNSGPDDLQCFRYDGLERLREAWTPKQDDCETGASAANLGGPAPYWQSWTFDSTGNRVTEVNHAVAGNTTQTSSYPEPGKPRTHAVSSVRTTGPGVDRTDSYTYDENGNLLTRPGRTGPQTLTWDVEGHLASIAESGATTSYLYDADGNRLIERGPKGTTLFLPEGECTVSGDNTPTCVRSYAAAGRVVATRTTQGVSWQVADHQSTGVASVDSATMTVTRRRSLPYGGARGPEPAWNSRRGFVNGVVDDTGLVHLGAREYDPKLGRFISVDPILDSGDPQSLNGYTYAGANPVTDSDPDGRVKCPDGDCIANPQPKEPVHVKTVLEVREEPARGAGGLPVKKRTMTQSTYKKNNGVVEKHRGCSYSAIEGSTSGPTKDCSGAGVQVLGPVTDCHRDNKGNVCWLGEDGFVYDVEGGKSCTRNDFNFCGTPAGQQRRQNRHAPPGGRGIPKMGPASKEMSEKMRRSEEKGWVQTVGACANVSAAAYFNVGLSVCLAHDNNGFGPLIAWSHGVGPSFGISASAGGFLSNGDFYGQTEGARTTTVGLKGGANVEGYHTASHDGKVSTYGGNVGIYGGAGAPWTVSNSWTIGKRTNW
ncbi:RHS repeat domain-containing protein [Jidongwangia harbinensis]|uniref:RHS repeat domain-containing protein n=1 Tax=Jidongwangia harbinensis TaxID=2878561 RepID=UPI001CD96858|nr:RHS repeat-associated core domain-containing protein [Jidongwangia harbinensis]MCA2217178.1 hypothetical protein [Jidongwangia harbinensis]